MYRIGEFATLCQVPIKTLRYYDDIGLLRPASTDRATGYRGYAAAQLEELNRILVFKDLGFSLAEIRGLLADRVPLDQIRALVVAKHRALEAEVARERGRLARAAARLAALGESGGVHEVAVRQVAPRQVASLRRTLRSHDDIGGLFEELERDTGRGRPRGAVWHACVAGAIDCEAVVFLPGRGSLSVQRPLPGARVASLVYRGDDDYLAAYQGMRSWLRASGLHVVGPKREVFLQESGPTKESVTEIQFPIARRNEARS